MSKVAFLTASVSVILKDIVSNFYDCLKYVREKLTEWSAICVSKVH